MEKQPDVVDADTSKGNGVDSGILITEREREREREKDDIRIKYV